MVDTPNDRQLQRLATSYPQSLPASHVTSLTV